MKLDKNAKKVIIKNRVKLLTLDYFDLTAPLLASEVLTTKKHKEIKIEANTNKARVDLLLEWLDETAPEVAFPSFLQGIRNCKELILAKKIKREAGSGNNSGLVPSVIKPSTPASSTTQVNSDASPEKSKPKKPKVNKAVVKIKTESAEPGSSGTNSNVALINGMPSFTSIQQLLPTPTSASRKRKSGADKRKSGADKPKSPLKSKPSDNLNGASVFGDVKVIARPIKSQEKNIKQIAKNTVTKNSPLPVPTIPRATRKSSSSEKGEEQQPAGANAKTSKQKKKREPIGKPRVLLPTKAGRAAAPASGSPSKPKSPGKATPAKTMTFKQAEDKQKESRQKFRFKNSEAVTTIIHFKDKTDISYLACPFEEDKKACEKRVELKSKEFICEVKHKSAKCLQIPYLNITCNDGTADLQLTLMKRDVEVFCGQTATEIGVLSVNDIEQALEKTMGRKLNIEVHCEKMKKSGKKASVPKWNNIANILPDTDGPTSAKKKRKN